MFIEQYKLETNPFARDGVRPFFVSESMRFVQLKLDHLLNGRLQTLFLSGLAGVGKSTLVGQHLRARKDVFLSWIKPGIRSPEELLAKLVVDIGPGEIGGPASELRNILEVYLRHQSSQGRKSIIVVDSLERFALPLIRELEIICRMRLRGKPIVHCIMVTRNEELISTLMSQQEESVLAPSLHQRLGGFTLEETRAYVRACLHGAGCSWIEELIPDDVILDVQGFTQGAVGNVNALCAAALDAVAALGSDYRQGRVTRALLKDAAARLNFRYDPTAWQPRVEGALSPDSVHVSDPNRLRVDGARLIVSSGGKLVAEISLNRPRLVLGRDEACDISLDSSYVSRYQNLFMETPDGWMLIDLNSTNGCFVNGRRVREHRLHDGDLIAVGQHQLRFTSPETKPHTPSARDPAEDTLVSPQPVIGKRA